MAATSKLFHIVVLATMARSRFVVVVLGLVVGGGVEGGVTACLVVGLVLVVVLQDEGLRIGFGVGDCG
jgi:hypothetical protein